MNRFFLNFYLFFLENGFSFPPLSRKQTIQLLSQKGLIKFRTPNQPVHIGEELFLQLVNQIVNQMVPLDVLGLELVLVLGEDVVFLLLSNQCLKVNSFLLKTLLQFLVFENILQKLSFSVEELYLYLLFLFFQIYIVFRPHFFLICFLELS